MSEVFNTSNWCSTYIQFMYMINPHLRSLHALRNAQKDKNTNVDLTHVTSTDIYLLYLGSIQGIDKADTSIPRIYVACHNSSEASTLLV